MTRRDERPDGGAPEAPSSADGNKQQVVAPERKDKRVCGAQMIHFDSQKQPLWLNCGLLVNKHDTNHVFSAFTHWMTAPGGSKVDDRRMNWVTIDQGHTWCAEGGQITPLAGTPVAELLEVMKRRARTARTPRTTRIT